MKSITEPEARTLVAQYRNGRGNDALNELILKSEPLIENALYKVGVHQNFCVDTEDCSYFQCVAMKGIKDAADHFNLNNGGNFLGYCCTCVKNNLRRELGKARAREKNRNRLKELLAPNNGTGAIMAVPPTQKNPSGIRRLYFAYPLQSDPDLRQAELRIDLQRFFVTLTKREKQIVQLKYSSNGKLTTREIAVFLGISQPAVQKHLASAYHKFEKYFGNGGYQNRVSVPLYV